MGEPGATVSGFHTMTGAESDSAESDGVTRRVLADVLLLQCPAGLDGIEVGRVRGLVDDPNAFCLAGRDDAGVMVGAEVVHDDHVATFQSRQEAPGQPRDEALLVGRLEHRVEDNPAREANGANQGQVLAPVHRDAIDELLATLDPRVAAAHPHAHAGFVEKNQPFDGNPSNLSQERFAFFDDVGPETFQRPDAFFFTT